jgi:hypothetical protein
MSDTVAAWENLDVLPRAFVVHRAQVMRGDEVFGALHDPQFNPRATVLLEEGEPLDVPGDDRDTVTFSNYQSDVVTLAVSTNRAGYLFLADTWYPGWHAFVDDRPAPLYRANAIFRAVPVDAGSHTVRFEFRPFTLWVGAIISLASLLIAGTVALRIR